MPCWRRQRTARPCHPLPSHARGRSHRTAAVFHGFSPKRGCLSFSASPRSDPSDQEKGLKTTQTTRPADPRNPCSLALERERASAPVVPRSLRKSLLLLLFLEKKKRTRENTKTQPNAFVFNTVSQRQAPLPVHARCVREEAP